MRIVHVTPYFPPHTGGVEVVAREIALRLAERGHVVTVLTSSVGASAGKVHQGGAIIHRLRTIEAAHTPLMPGLLPALLSALPADIVHVHVAQAYVPEITQLAAALRSTPYIAHIHLDVEPTGKFGFLLPTYKRALLARFLRGASAVICLTEHQAKLIRLKYNLPGRLLRVIPNGTGDEHFLRRAYKPHMPRRLFCNARLAPQKRIDRLLGALALLRTPTETRIVGTGELAGEHEKLRKALGLKKVSFVGTRYGAEKLTEYHRADAFVLTSDAEGMPIVLLEAMAAGLPCFVSDLPELRETLGSAGVLVFPLTEGAFAKALERELTSAARLRKLSAASRKRAERYRWKNIIIKHEQLYREVRRGNL